MNQQCKACSNPISTSSSVGYKNGYELLRCNHCQTVTVSPFPSEDDLKKFYQNYKGTEGYSKKKDKKIKRSLSRIKKIKKYANGNRFLDVGCNAGYTVYAAKSLDLDAYGIELDCETVKLAKREFGDNLFKCETIQEHAKSGHHYNIIYSSEVIEHIPDPDTFIQAAADLLEQDGLLYLTTPDGNHFSLPKDFTEWQDVKPPEHIIYFSKKGIKILLEKHNFSIVRFFFNLKPGIKLIARKLI